MNAENLKQTIQTYLPDEITEFNLKGKGCVNYAYYIETKSGGRYIVKIEREDALYIPPNSLMVEATLIKNLASFHVHIPIPKVVFISEHPLMYGYEYLDGEVLKLAWHDLTEEERIEICTSLGNFHGEVGNKISEEDAVNMGVIVNRSSDVHPKHLTDFDAALENPYFPEEYKVLARKAKELFDTTHEDVYFQFLHNDGHRENVLIKDKKISGIIDYGNAEYGEIAKEFAHYIREFPHHFQYIISAYEEKSGNKLSLKRLITYSFLSSLHDFVLEYIKGGQPRSNTEKSMEEYERLME